MRQFQFALLVMAALMAGCVHSRRVQLEHAAKDWCMTIRASQVIPVYPLSEDIQPGDVFLVQLPVDRQQEAYAAEGFLPLDNQISRVIPSGYEAFYARSFGGGGADQVLPRHWLLASIPWDAAPTAAFPSYGFTVHRGGGLSVAVPLHGVPVGLSLLNASAATGSISIADARTCGLDSFSLAQDVRTWARDAEVRRFLAQYAPGPGPAPAPGNPSAPSASSATSPRSPNYIRVISRIYLTKKMNVSLTNTRSDSAALSAGDPKPVDLLVPSTKPDHQAATAEAYSAGLAKINSSIQTALQNAGDKALPGGTLKVVAASSRTISLVETFPRPIVVGYLGFDMEIKPGGLLGPPIPTHARLENQAVNIIGYSAAHPALKARIHAWLARPPAEGETSHSDRLEEWLARGGVNQPGSMWVAGADNEAALQAAIDALAIPE